MKIVPHVLPSYALTGCETVSSIYGVGNVKAVKALQKGDVTPNMRIEQIYIEVIVSGATVFTAALYGSKCNETMRRMRFNIRQSSTGRSARSYLSSCHLSHLLRQTLGSM